uniref:SB domain-containing protein n=1 Tax=Plectus sambesii TaxID=2011161 RepID=A0A914XKZ3_9BILA
MHGELASIRQTQQELRSGQQTLRNMLERLDSEQSELEAKTTTYQDKRDELKRILDVVPADDDLQIDNAIDTVAPLHRQLLNSYVEDCAIEDSIYFLGQGLKKGTIGLDVYLKCIRKLSRQQFIQRATMQKCRQKAGLSV